MLRTLFVAVGLLMCSSASAEKRQENVSFPDSFLIGRHTFFDFGPPFDFYEIFVVGTTENGTSVEKLTVTPAGNECFQPPKVEVASVKQNNTVESLLRKNPCRIPEKDLRKELKRCKHCLKFSGANISMQVRCGNQVRTIRADILDRDMFDPLPNTPTNTSWTMRLLQNLDELTGPGVWDRPVFVVPQQKEPKPTIPDSAEIRDLSEGKYDSLFLGAPHKPSAIYQDVLSTVATPSSVQLVKSDPVFPETFMMPDYPRIAALARVDGTVSLLLQIGNDGKPNDVTVEKGHKLLTDVVQGKVKDWKFPENAVGRQVRVEIQFNFNCPGGRLQRKP